MAQTSQRLVTQNLLVSAASHELQGKTSWQAIHDLSVLIETFCLYDEIVVLGRQAYSMLPNRSDIISAAGDIIRVEQPASNSQLTGAACGHLGAFLNERLEVDRYQRLIESLFEPQWVERAFDTRPDDVADFQSGADWLRTVPDNVDILTALDKDEEFHRGTTFLARTFLYLAYTDIHRLPLTPDQTRTRVLDPIVTSERRLRKMLLSKLDEQFQKNYFAADDRIKRHITPLASIVFDRAYPKPQNIAKEMVELRFDLSTLRERLSKIDQQLAEGSRADELALSRKWNNVFQEVEKVYGAGEGLMTLEGTLTFAENAGEIAKKPDSVSSWVKMLKLPVEVVRRMLARLPIVEIHQMQFPSSEKLQNVAHKLFGEVLEDPKYYRS